MPPTPKRPVYVLRLRPEPGIDPERAVRAVLKVALRRYGMKCVGLESEVPADEISQNDSRPAKPA